MMPVLEALAHAALHAGEETLRLLPFLYLSYLLMEWLEHKAGARVEALICRAGRIGPLFGGALGILPQCGFSAAAAGLYAGRIITVGTLVAVFLSTSDEMLPILLSGGLPLPSVLALVAIKAGIGIAVGFALDLFFSVAPHESHAHVHEGVDELCREEGCDCHGKSPFLSALIHAARVALFVLLASFLLGFAIELLGEEKIGLLVRDIPVVGVLLSTLVGLIPSCASSVILSRLYLSGAISVGALLSGLLIGAGAGWLVLFRARRDWKKNLSVALFLYVVSVAFGLLADAISLGTLLGL